MTDAERTPEQGDATEQTEQTEQSGGLLGRLLDKAKDMVEVVVDKAKDVAGTVAERAPDVMASVSETAGKAVDRVQHLVSGDTDDAKAEATHEQALGGPEATAQSVAYTEPTTEDALTGDAAPADAQPDGDASTLGERVEAATETVRDAVAPAVAAVSDVVTPAVAAVRKTVARIYQNVTGTAPEAKGDKGERGEGRGGRPRRFKDVQPGMQLEGKVTSIALYGIFVDVGVGRDGLVHISEMSDKRIESPTDLVQIGTPVTVWVKSVDPDARRISLTMRDPNRAKPERRERPPRQERGEPRRSEVDREKLASLKVGDVVEGKISSVAPFGAFVDIGVGKDGLVHISELAEGRVEKPEDAVSVGQVYNFKILEVDPEGNRISLSRRRAQRTQRMQELAPGTEMDGTISGLAPFGAFVDVGVGRDGLVHISELTSERVNKVEDVVKVGDKVKVKVIEIDGNSKRISLTMRVEEPLPTERPKPAPRAFGTGGFAGGTSEFGGGDQPRTFGADRPAGGGERRGGFGDRPGGGRDDGNRGGTSRGGRRDRGRGQGGEDEEISLGSGARTGRGGGGGGGGRRAADATGEVYTFEDPQEESFSGDASLEDLLSKFNSGKGRDNKRGKGEEEDADSTQRSDAIRRTLALREEE